MLWVLLAPTGSMRPNSFMSPGRGGAPFSRGLPGVSRYAGPLGSVAPMGALALDESHTLRDCWLCA